MLNSGIINPNILHLLSRVRHTNTLVIADRGFPFWPQIETVDVSLVDDIPRVLHVLEALLPNFNIGRIFVASEFFQQNSEDSIAAFRRASSGIELIQEPHWDFRKRVPQAIGLIRTADTRPYSNLIVESA